MGAFIRKNDRLWFSLKKHIVLRNKYCDKIIDKDVLKSKSLRSNSLSLKVLMDITIRLQRYSNEKI